MQYNFEGAWDNIRRCLCRINSNTDKDNTSNASNVDAWLLFFPGRVKYV